VLFVGLVGSTALSARLDPEDLRVVMRAYRNACAAAVSRSGGHAAKFLGDGVLAYFG
jgi:class 3 adenylate cyclase